MKGKEKCSLLKGIRCQIARKNNIEYTVSECTFQGECKGTCPKCEAELRHLANELEKLKLSGKRVAVAGIAAAMVAASTTGCTPRDSLDDDEWKVESDVAGILAEEFDGKPAYDPDDEELTGDVSEPQEEELLDGDYEIVTEEE